MYSEGRSTTSGIGRYAQPELDDRDKRKWDVFLSHMEKLGQIVSLKMMRSKYWIFKVTQCCIVQEWDGEKKVFKIH